MKVYVVVYNKGCHSCAGEVEAVFTTKLAADAYVKDHEALLGLPKPYSSDEGFYVDVHELNR